LDSFVWDDVHTALFPDHSGPEVGFGEIAIDLVDRESQMAWFPDYKSTRPLVLIA